METGDVDPFLVASFKALIAESLLSHFDFSKFPRDWIFLPRPWIDLKIPPSASGCQHLAVP
jgi:hypothetical protein